MKVSDVLYKIGTGLILCLQFFATYVGFVTFFYASVQILFSYFLALVTDCLSNDFFSLFSNFLWIFASIPFIFILVVVNFQTIYAFVIDLGKLMNFSETEKRLREFFQNPLWCHKSNRVDRWGFFFLFSVFMNLIFLFIEIASTDDQTVCSLAFAGFTSYPPLFGIIFVIFKCIPLYRRHEKSSNFTDVEVLSQSFVLPNDNSAGEIQKDSVENDNENLDEVPNEEQQVRKATKWEVYFDPLQLIVQKECLDFVKDPETNHYKYLSFNRKSIPSLIVLAIFIEYFIFVIYQFIELSEIRTYIDTIFFVIKLCYSLFCLRFLIVFNLIDYIFLFKKIKQKHKFVWWTYLTAIILAGIIILAFLIALIVIHSTFNPHSLNEFHFSPSYKNVTINEQSSLCQIQFYDMNLLEYAGVASLGQSKDSEIATEILKMVFNKTIDIEPLDNPLSYSYAVNFNETFSVRVLESLTDRTSLSFMMNLFMNDFVINKVAAGPIPFFYLAIDIFLYRFVYFLTLVLNRYFSLHSIANFAYFSNQLYAAHDQYLFANKSVAYVGHSIGGLIAKGIGSKRNLPAVAFETLEYYHSLFHMSINSDSFSSFDFKSERSKLMNIYSPSQLLSEAEETSTINVLLPQWKPAYHFTNAYETFCSVAAGCATNARYDEFCKSVMGQDEFYKLFRIWNRTRSDDIYNHLNEDR